MSEIKDLVVRGAELKLQIKAMDEELKTINAAIAKLAEFKNGAKTGHLLESGIKVTVSLRENVKWMQDRLMTVKDLLPDQFYKAFIYKYEPASSKELKAAMEENAEFAKAVEWAREVKPGSPTVTYERIEDEEPPF